MTKEEILHSKVFLLDLDGTVYLGERPLEGAAEALSRLRKGGRLVFLTNNSSKSEKVYREKLFRLGLWGEGDLVYTSGMATAAFLRENFAGKRVYLAGTEGLKAEFAEEGISLTEEDPEVCVLAYDTELTFAKIRAFDKFLRRGAYFIATHPDDVCPTEEEPMPDVGSFLALFARSSGRSPNLIVGKPFETMGKELEKLLKVSRKEMCMIGDRMYTDIRFANNNGMKSVLVLSGETKAEEIGNFPDLPDLILPSVADLFA